MNPELKKTFDYSDMTAAEQGRSVIRLLASEGCPSSQAMLVALEQCTFLLASHDDPQNHKPFKKIEVQRHANGNLLSATQRETSVLQEHVNCFLAMIDEIHKCYPEAKAAL